MTSVYKNVYLVDDDYDYAFLIERAFKEACKDTKFTHLGDGFEFLKRLGDGELNDGKGLILLDINMPKVSGFDVLRRIKGHSASKRLTFVVLTTSESVKDRETALELGAQRFQTKPYSFEELINFAVSVL